LAVDIMKTAAGGWLILEVGDGVSLLPPRLDPQAYYRNLKERQAG
jgi:hypothetical protein